MRKPEQRRRREFNFDRLRRVFAALLAVVAICCSATLAGAEKVPIPRPPQRWVTDEAGLISPGARTELDQKLASYEQKTGHQVVVWIGETIGTEPLDDFAVRTFEAWKIGRKGSDDGVLLIVLAQDRKMAIEVGYGLEPRLPDATASRIINDVMAPKLRAGQADEALTAGVDAILASIEGAPFEPDNAAPAPAAQRERPSIGKVIGIAAVILVFIFLFATNPALAMSLLYVMASGRRGHGGGGFGGGGFSGGGGRSGGGGARGSW